MEAASTADEVLAEAASTVEAVERGRGQRPARQGRTRKSPPRTRGSPGPGPATAGRGPASSARPRGRCGRTRAAPPARGGGGADDAPRPSRRPLDALPSPSPLCAPTSRTFSCRPCPSSVSSWVSACRPASRGSGPWPTRCRSHLPGRRRPLPAAAAVGRRPRAHLRCPSNEKQRRAGWLSTAMPRRPPPRSPEAPGDAFARGGGEGKRGRTAMFDVLQYLAFLSFSLTVAVVTVFSFWSSFLVFRSF